MWRLTMAMGNSRLIGVYKEVKKPQYEMVLTGVYMDAENVIIEVPEKFAGIVILASLTKRLVIRSMSKTLRRKILQRLAVISY